MKLPQLIKDRKTLWVYLFVGGASTLIPYQLLNRFHLFEPKELLFDKVDMLMPFWPWTVWVYIWEYLYFLYAWFGLKNNENRTRYFYAYMAILFFSFTVFLLYPVTFPRHDYPVPGNSFSDWGLTFLRTYMDAPANCLPSLHVSSCFISSLCFWSESRKRAILLSLGSVAVSISTMTTKQHYFIDVWTAILLTAAAYWFFFYRVKLTGTGKEAGANR